MCVSSDESISETEKERGSQHVFSALTHAGGDRNTVTMVTDDVLLDPPLSLFFSLLGLPICVPLLSAFHSPPPVEVNTLIM